MEDAPRARRHRCYYCHFESEDGQTVIDHSCSCHQDSILKIKVLQLHPSIGKIGFQTKNLQIIPSKVLNGSNRIIFDSSSSDFLVMEDANLSDADYDMQDLFKQSSSTNTCSPKSKKSKYEPDNGNSQEDDEQQILLQCVPEVLNEMRKAGFSENWINLNLMLAKKEFPLNNISFLLFMDVCKFLSLENASAMRYSDKVKQFWRIGFKLFHGKWLRFMGGPKHRGELVCTLTEKGMFKPCNSDINFAVPHRAVVSSELSPLSSEQVTPGIIHSLLTKFAEKAEPQKTFKICIDGKKINSALTAKHGDVDLWGNEASPTLEERQLNLKHDNQLIEGCSNFVTKMMDFQKLNLNDLAEDDKKSLIQLLQKIITSLSLRVRTLRETVLQEEKTKTRLMNSVEGEWRKSKLVFVISGITTHLFDLKSCIRSLLRDIDDLCTYIVMMNESVWTGNGVFNMTPSRQHITTNVDLSSPLNYRYVEQRSPMWHDLRNQAKVTGSTIFNAIGLGTFKAQLEHFDNVMFQKPKPEPSKDVSERMLHGTENEIHASATFAGKFLPVFHPDLSFFEEGCYQIITENNVNVIISPDGSCRKSVKDPAVFGVECKCPTSGLFKTPVHYNIPKYYIPQILSEMKSLDVSELYFVSFSKESTTIQKATFDPNLWNELQIEIGDVYKENSRRPSTSKRRTSCIGLGGLISNFAQNNVRLVAEISSIHGSYENDVHRGNVFEKKEPTLEYIKEDLINIGHDVGRAYNLTRKKASELLGFMLSDLDREFSFDQLHSVPIAYGLKGYSLPCSTLRTMIESVLKECNANGLYTPVCSFDGQWAGLTVRDKNGQPLTVLQLQKDVFSKVTKMSKPEILSKMCSANIIDSIHLTSEDDMKRNLDVTFGGHGSISVKGQSVVEYNMFSNLVDMIRKGSPSITELITPDVDSLVSALPSDVVLHLNVDVIEEIGKAVNYSDTRPDFSSSSNDDISSLFSEQPKESHDFTDELGTKEQTNKESDMEIALDEQTRLLNDEDVVMMLQCLKDDERSNKKGKWNIHVDDFINKFENAETISKSFLGYDLQVCLKPIIGKLKANGLKINLTSSKLMHVNVFSMLLGDKSKLERNPNTRTKKVQKVSTLKSLCKEQLQKLTKQQLNIIYAENVFPQELHKWYQNSPFGKHINIAGIECDELKTWYCYPEFNVSVGYYVFMILDAYHQLCGLRRLFCADGIPDRGVLKQSILRVAEESNVNGCGLNIALVKDLIDKQSIAYAVQTFSEKVESALENIGASNEAEFCSLVRHWYMAEDDPGISAILRCKYRLDLREWLLRKINFGIFPPSGGYAKGIPIVLFEGLLVGIERRLQLFSFTKTGSYNVRCIGSLDIENFFGSFQDYDPWGTGVLRPDSIPTAFSVAAELIDARLNPERTFHMCTSAAKVYPCNTYGVRTDYEYDAYSTSTNFRDLKEINVSDHGFDKQERARGSRKRKTGTVSQPQEPARKPLTVREYHRAHESKILPHVRRGINLDNL